MAAKKFDLIYRTDTKDHLTVIERKHHSLIKDTIKNQLTYEPEVETLNRKPLRKPSEFGSAWELRFGQNNKFRVFYITNVENREVYILAIGYKEGNRLYIGKKVIKL